MLRYLRILTGGESHGPALVGILDGIPAGLMLDLESLHRLLRMRREGYGRGGRARHMEEDHVEVIGGLFQGKTTGSPLVLRIANRGERDVESEPPWRIPRPGHADFSGVRKYGFSDIRPVNERASARETAIRTALGGVALQLLHALDIMVLGYTVGVGSHDVAVDWPWPEKWRVIYQNRKTHRDTLLTRTIHPKWDAEFQMVIDKARAKRTTVGGRVEVVALNIPVGLGSYTQWDRRLDARLSGMLMSIPSVKGVEIGEGVEVSRMWGNRAQDAFFPGNRGIRRTNWAGGIEGGVTNGMPLRLRVYVKPLPTQPEGLPSVDLQTGRAAPAPYVRSDVCVVPAISIISEACTALVLADALLERYASDRLEYLQEAVDRDRHGVDLP